VKRTDLGTKGQRRCLKACWLVDQCCRLLQFFPPILCWRSSSEFHLCNLRAFFSLLVFCTFFFPVLQILYAKNESKDRKAVPAGLWFFVFPAPSPFFFLLLCTVFCVFFLSLSGNWDGWRQWYCNFYAQPVITASGDIENDGHAGSLFLFFPSADALCGDDEGDDDENVLCWLSSRPYLCVFLLLTVAFCFLFFFRSSPFFFCLASHLSFFL